MNLDARIEMLERKQEDTKHAIKILATAIGARSDRELTLGNEVIGTSVDLLSDGELSTAVSYYNQAKRTHS